MSLRWLVICGVILCLNLPEALADQKTTRHARTSKRRAIASQSTASKAQSEARKFKLLAAQLKRASSFRAYLCRALFYDVQRSVNRQHRLVLRYLRYECKPKIWRQCHQDNYSSATCRDKSARLRFGACFRIHRRLFVITHRLSTWRKEARNARCRWTLRLPQSFAQVEFAPYPKLSQK